MQDLLTLTKALSDETRLRALMMLSEGELCVCQLIEMLGLAPSTVSKHMSILRQARLVVSRKEGRWIYYRLSDQRHGAPAEITRWLTRHLAGDPAIARDRERLQAVKKMDTEQVSQCYRKG